MEKYYSDRIEGFKNTYNKNPVGKKVAERLFEQIKNESNSPDFERRIYIGLEGDKIYNCLAVGIISKSNVPEKIRKILDSEEYKQEFPYIYYQLMNITKRYIGALGLGWYRGYYNADVKKAKDIYESRKARGEKDILNDLIKVPEVNNKNNGRL